MQFKGLEFSNKYFCKVKFAFAERSAAMKAPVGLLSDRTVLRSKMEGSHPDKFAFAQHSNERGCCKIKMR